MKTIFIVVLVTRIKEFYKKYHTLITYKHTVVKCAAMWYLVTYEFEGYDCSPKWQILYKDELIQISGIH